MTVVGVGRIPGSRYGSVGTDGKRAVSEPPALPGEAGNVTNPPPSLGSEPPRRPGAQLASLMATSPAHSGCSAGFPRSPHCTLSDLVSLPIPQRKAQITCTAIFILWGVLVHLVIPPFVFMVTEEWDYIEGLYYSFITISTIGFGDFVAGESCPLPLPPCPLPLPPCPLFLCFSSSFSSADHDRGPR